MKLDLSEQIEIKVFSESQSRQILMKLNALIFSCNICFILKRIVDQKVYSGNSITKYENSYLSLEIKQNLKTLSCPSFLVIEVAGMPYRFILPNILL